MGSKHVEFLVKLRDGLTMASDAVNEYLDSLMPKEATACAEDVPNTAVLEATFSTLHFEPHRGVALGQYATAHKRANLADKWSHAYNVLRVSNATIQNRYCGDGYQYSYWLYGDDTIFRQKAKVTT